MESEKLIMGSDEDKSEKWEVVSTKLKVKSEKWEVVSTKLKVKS
ncbi:hypothetical protein FORMB_20080 [Formosa sp. Hel1_33_131]|nr:hypothetical protein FORMB_20080 [Formosa sp. Hel1_33_131]